MSSTKMRGFRSSQIVFIKDTRSLHAFRQVGDLARWRTMKPAAGQLPVFACWKFSLSTFVLPRGEAEEPSHVDYTMISTSLQNYQPAGVTDSYQRTAFVFGGLTASNLSAQRRATKSSSTCTCLRRCFDRKRRRTFDGGRVPEPERPSLAATAAWGRSLQDCFEQALPVRQPHRREAASEVRRKG